MKYIFTSFLFSFLCLSAFAQDQGHTPNDFFDSSRFNVNPDLEPFYHGVASGDPTSNSVMLWTRVTTDSTTAAIRWQIATDTGMVNIVNEGWTSTDASQDFTVKVDVSGLDPYTTYYYEFFSHDKYSLRGRTKTAPTGTHDRLRFGVVSCSNFAHGYFHVYEKLVDRNDIDAVIHLGDYVYEYGDGEYGDVRQLDPSTEMLTLADYRMRHSYYKLDPQLMKLHQQYPIIATWDDHESANDSWKGGADNHNAGEGDWVDRKSYSIQAYNDWMPFRKPDVADTERIYRKLNYSDLMTLYMLDTRLIGRDEQDGTGNTDPARTILGADQYNWLANEMQASTSKWNVLGNQVMMAPLELPFIGAINADQWDGYPVERDNLHNMVISNNVSNMVVLTGDIHTSWANDIPMSGYDEDTGANSAGVEFVTTSVTSPGFPIPVGEGIIVGANDHIKWANLTEKGYIILDIDDTKAQADWYHIGSVTDATTTEAHADSWYTLDGTRHLQNAAAPTTADPSFLTTYAPSDPRNNPTISTNEINELAFLGLHPNPVMQDIYIQFYNHETVDLQLQIYDVMGRLLFQEDLGIRGAGLQNQTVNVSKIPQGTYFMILKSSKGTYRKTFVKM
ncbi:MAG: alkaline phosphatase D family protein [Saprospiraceae bacterium]